VNYDSARLIDLLAREYVLGTLRGGARRRFERLLHQRPDVRSAVWRWESSLGELSLMLAPVSPPSPVWSAVARRIEPVDLHPHWWRSIGLWRAWSLAASTALVVLLVVSSPFTTSPPPPDSAPDHVSVIGDGSEPLWLLSANLETGAITARAVNAVAADVDKVFELWMLPESGPPISMGLLPVGGKSVTRSLPAGLRTLLRQSKGIAVSIEPAGGSPTGAPTGPVVHTARVVSL
jgi:anti-sigma-K factor RskA